MNIWLGGASGLFCVKQILSYHFLKTKTSAKQLDLGDLPL
jgi:hypothetical protein